MRQCNKSRLLFSFKRPLWQTVWTQIRLLLCSWSTLFATIVNSSVMLGNYLQQTTSADDIFRCILMFLWPCSLAVPVLTFFVVLCPGTPEGSTGSGSGFKASQKTGQRLKVSSDRLGEAGNRTCDPWFTRHRFIPYTTAASLKVNSMSFHNFKSYSLLNISHGSC